MDGNHAARPELPVHEPRPSDAPTALGGTLVADFSRVLAGPVCTQLLGDLGARVVKIEHPDGDDMRYASQASIGGLTAAFLALNRGKQSLVLDLATPAGTRSRSTWCVAPTCWSRTSRPASWSASGWATTQSRRSIRALFTARSRLTVRPAPPPADRATIRSSR